MTDAAGGPDGPDGRDPRHPLEDHRLGQQIGVLIQAAGGREFQATPLLNQVQDLLGPDTALIAPMWDLLRRPGFRALFSAEPQAVQRGRRDALLAELSAIYSREVLTRLTLIIDGCLGHPPGPPPSSVADREWASIGPSASWSGAPPSSASGWGPSTAGPAPWSAPPAPSPAPVPAVSPNPLTVILIALVSLLAGGVLVALGWLVMLNRPIQSVSPSPASTPALTPQRRPSQPATRPAPSPLPPAAEPKSPITIASSETAAGAWGGPDQYKFGTLPGDAYPNSCAFSRTNDSGQIIQSRSEVEYWACRDVGGDPATGYSVVWADGKQTNYTFSRDGSGTVVGTNGTSYPMRWSNETHAGSNIIVINHEDGATTWIPGHVQ